VFIEVVGEVHEHQLPRAGLDRHLRSLEGRGVDGCLARGLVEQQVGPARQLDDRRVVGGVAGVRGHGAARGLDAEADHRDRVRPRGPRDAPVGVPQHRGADLVRHHPRRDAGVTGPVSGVERVVQARGLRHGGRDPDHRKGGPPAGQPEPLDHQRQAPDVVGVLVGDDERTHPQRIEALGEQSLDDVPTAVDHHDAGRPFEGQHGGRAAAVAERGARSQDVDDLQEKPPSEPLCRTSLPQ